MSSTGDFELDCNTCVAANTTACADCIVTHLLANDDGPIDLEPVPFHDPLTDVHRAVGLLAKAGLVGPEPQFVSTEEFEGSHLVALR